MMFRNGLKLIYVSMVVPFFWAAVSFFASKKFRIKRVTVVEKRRPVFLIAGGYGYNNVGDEVQLAQNIRRIKSQFPEAKIVVLTPDLNLTRSVHQDCEVALAPRVIFFNSHLSNAYANSDVSFQNAFKIKAPRLYLGALFMRCKIPAPFISKDERSFFDLIRSVDVLYMSGGGYLTGMTLSRLWDNMLLFRLADVFGTQVVLSGQQVGLFNDAFSRNIARWGFQVPSVVALRDPERSEAELRSIGIFGPHVVSLFDDALFFKGSSRSELSSFLNLHGIGLGQKYIVLNAHFWGQSPATQDAVVEGIAQALRKIFSWGHKVIFVSMHESDKAAWSRLTELVGQDLIYADHQFSPSTVVGLFHHAEVVLTFKHHPIIFSAGNGVPVVAIYMDEYYRQKNSGAMGLFSMSELEVDASGDLYNLGEMVITKFKYALDNRSVISSNIKQKVEQLGANEAYVASLVSSGGVKHG